LLREIVEADGFLITPVDELELLAAIEVATRKVSKGTTSAGR